MATIGGGSIEFEGATFDPAAIESQIAELFTFVGQLSAGQADLPAISPTASETVTITPTPALIDNTYTFVPWIAGLGTPALAAELQITDISQVDDFTWNVQVTNNSLVNTSDPLKVVALFIDNP